jgi:hypothetical protein
MARGCPLFIYHLPQLDAYAARGYLEMSQAEIKPHWNLNVVIGA